MLDGPLDVIGSVAQNAFVVSIGQVHLGHGPLFWEVLLRPHLQSIVVVLDGPLDVIGSVA